MVPKIVGDFCCQNVLIPHVNPKRKQALLESNLRAIGFTDWNGQRKALDREPSVLKDYSKSNMA